MTVGERCLLVPQMWAYLMNPHHEGNVIGHGLEEVEGVVVEIRDAAKDMGLLKSSWPSWEDYKPDLPGWARGLMVIRDGKLENGPAEWDTSG